MDRIDRRILRWIDRKQYFAFLLKTVSGSALYKAKGIEKNILDFRMAWGFFLSVQQ